MKILVGSNCDPELREALRSCGNIGMKGSDQVALEMTLDNAKKDAWVPKNGAQVPIICGEEMPFV